MRSIKEPFTPQIDFDRKDIFEVGCGYGKFTQEHFLNAKSVFGIDTNREAVESLQKNWPISQEETTSLFQVGNIVDIDLQGKQFDFVVFSNSF